MANPNIEYIKRTYDSVTYSRSSLSESLKFIASSDFLSKITKTDKVHNISFKINNGVLTKLNETSFAHFFDTEHLVLISFESTTEERESKIFWKLSGCEEFYLLELPRHCNELLTEFCRRFLFEEIGNNNCGKNRLNY